MRFQLAVECGFFDFAISELPPFGEQIGKTARVRPSVPSGGYDVVKMADREFESEEGNSELSYGRISNAAISSPPSWKESDLDNSTGRQAGAFNVRSDYGMVHPPLFSANR
ncbi:MAG: hypothetical protein DME21_02560 [Verrucomicrobia bacterium]|nr:MAG: hypothetical protein DME21_02560 [Verrucomicrobiota bacterium]